MTDRVLLAAASLLSEQPNKASPGSGWPCCELVARVVRRAFEQDGDHDIADGSLWWQRANVWDPSQPWSSVDAYIVGGQAQSALRWLDGRYAKLTPGKWHPVQAWRVLDELGHVPANGPEINGHTWLWYAVSETHGIALESSEAGGVRWLGRVVRYDEDLVMPPSGWLGQPWADRIAPYAAGVAVAVLRAPAAEPVDVVHHATARGAACGVDVTDIDTRVTTRLDARGVTCPACLAALRSPTATAGPRWPVEDEPEIPPAAETLRSVHRPKEPAMSIDPDHREMLERAKPRPPWTPPASIPAGTSSPISIPLIPEGLDIAGLAEQAVRAAGQLVGAPGERRHRVAVRLLAEELDERIRWPDTAAGRLAEQLDGAVLKLVLGGAVKHAYERIVGRA